VTGQRLTSIEAKLRSLLPGYQFGVGGNFAQEFEQELKQLKSTVWHYHVCFDKPQSVERVGNNSASNRVEKQIVQTQPSQPNDKAEALFAKRARRYAQSEGHINAEQRADLETFAQKYGIDEFRMEELIEEAFV
jgi:hypothetical protein